MQTDSITYLGNVVTSDIQNMWRCLWLRRCQAKKLYWPRREEVAEKPSCKQLVINFQIVWKGNANFMCTKPPRRKKLGWAQTPAASTWMMLFFCVFLAATPALVRLCPNLVSVSFLSPGCVQIENFIDDFYEEYVIYWLLNLNCSEKMGITFHSP